MIQVSNKGTMNCMIQIEGQSKCRGEDLLTECIKWCKKFEIRCVLLGVEKDKENHKQKTLNLKSFMERKL